MLSTVIFSSITYAGWTEITKGENSSSHYVDFERIRKHDGFVYFWSMSNYPTPIKGVSSEINLRQGDCKLFRYKIIDGSFYNKPMLRGSPSKFAADSKWRYAQPNTIGESFLQSVCNR